MCMRGTIAMRNSRMRNFRELQMRVQLLCYTDTRIGRFYIAERGGRFHPIFNDRSLGSYARAQQAAEDLAGGHTFSIPGCADTADLGIPDDVHEWHRCSR